MYNSVLVLHNVLRWIILVFLLWNIVRHFSAGSGPFTPNDKRIGLWLMVSAHLNLLAGLYLWFLGAWGLSLIRQNGMSAVMKDNTMRFFAVEHILTMAIAIILITIGRGIAKRPLPDRSKHLRSAWFFFIALILILVAIPWPFRHFAARPWFPGV